VDVNQIVGYFNKVLFTVDRIEVSLFTIVTIFIPALIFYAAGKYFIRILSRKLPGLWELSGGSRFIFEIAVRLFFVVMGISIGFEIAGIDRSFLYYFYRFLFKPFFVIGSSPVSVISIALLLIIISGSMFLSKYLIKLLQNDVYPNTTLEIGIQNVINAFLKYFVLATGVIIGLQVNGINLSVFATIGAGLMVGIGFGLQNIASNFISGIVILLERPIKVGDYVDVNGVLGHVEQINGRSTLLRTRENIQMIVPNSKFISEKIINWSHNNLEVMVQVPIGISYANNPERAREVLLKIASDHGLVLDMPLPVVRLHEYGDSSINLVLEIWITEHNRRFEVISDINFKIYSAFKENDIHIPYPQMDVHMRN